ncbi:MAG: peptidase S1 [Pararhodobacter sp.]
MSKLFRTAFAALTAAALLGQTPAEAQNYNLRPSYGSVTLNAGFLPDPHTRTVRAGGDIHFSGGGGCPGGGWFANAPDYRLHYRAGGYPLTIYVSAPGDTMLLVNDPSATWFCNDDANGTLDPMIRFNNPRSGQYDIWVGTYNRSRVRNSTIFISER